MICNCCKDEIEENGEKTDGLGNRVCFECWWVYYDPEIDCEEIGE